MASVPWGTLVYSRLERSEQRLCLWLVTQEGIRTDGQGGGGWWVGCGQLRPVAPSSQPDLEEGHVGSEGLTEVHAGCCRGRWLPAPGVGEAVQVWARPARRRRGQGHSPLPLMPGNPCVFVGEVQQWRPREGCVPLSSTVEIWGSLCP